MAENEKKTEVVKSTEKKPAKAKADKPSLWSRITAWFKSVKSESKKVSWVSWKSVRSNGTIVIVAVVIIAIALGIIDIAFSGALNGLANLIK